MNTTCVGTIPLIMDVNITCLSYSSCNVSMYISSCVLNILVNEPALGNCSISTTIMSDTTVREVEMNLTEYLSQGHHYEITVTLTTLSIVPSTIATLNLSMYWMITLLHYSLCALTITYSIASLLIGTFDISDATISSYTDTSVCIECIVQPHSTVTGFV